MSQVPGGGGEEVTGQTKNAAMKTTEIILVCGLIGLWAAVARAADVAGQWRAEFDTQVGRPAATSGNRTLRGTGFILGRPVTTTCRRWSRSPTCQGKLRPHCVHGARRAAHGARAVLFACASCAPGEIMADLCALLSLAARPGPPGSWAWASSLPFLGQLSVRRRRGCYGSRRSTAARLCLGMRETFIRFRPTAA